MSADSSSQQAASPAVVYYQNMGSASGVADGSQTVALISNGIEHATGSSAGNFSNLANKNYINFNEFIRQHNFVDPREPNMRAEHFQVSDPSTRDFANPFAEANNSGHKATSSSQASNLFAPTYGGPNANPFSMDAASEKSNLNANSPEFLPRLKSLSLNDSNQANGNGGGGVGAGHVPAYSDHFVMHENSFVFNSNNAKEPKRNEELQDEAGAQGVDHSSSAAYGRNRSANSKQKARGGYYGNGYGGNSYYAERKDNNAERKDKFNAARAERVREVDKRRYQNERRVAELQERDESAEMPSDRYERRPAAAQRYERTERADRYERGERINGSGGAGRSERGGQRGMRDRDRDYHRQFENHRNNKRRDDWNRNRDRVNGFRMEEKYSLENSKESPTQSPEKKAAMAQQQVYPDNEKLSQREKLSRDIELRRLECLVCVEPIKVHNAIWSCNNCYHIMHLQCIIKWASSSKSEDGWRCPACQNVEKNVPRDYYCFCGKTRDPHYNRQDLAHTCGEVCARIDGCPHACTLLCHPGPCPPCQANVQRACGCGRTTKTMQCYLKEAIGCEAICENFLNCELHTCKQKCHDGKCAPCEQKVDQTCHCTKQQRQVTCARDTHDKHSYSCGKPCAKDLACGNHKCKDCCHAGECRPCKLSPEMVTSCPCGKLPIESGARTSCLDAIPVCADVCGKTLRCGKAVHPHHCTSKCHAGNCPPCNKQTAVKCRCGHMDQMIKCRQLSTRADDVRCKKRCVKKRSCGKHKCNQECCIDLNHICPLPCNYTLSCGKHKCDLPCHRGNCPPCYRSSFDELYCECGAEVIYPPVPCGTKRPVCKRACNRAHPCEHAPQHNCHSAQTCPPCMMFTTKWCFGQHEQRKTIPCSQASFGCGLACGKPLACGRHKCIKPCHEGACQVPTDICKQPCTKIRDVCGHKCMAPCHKNDCPDAPCKEPMEVQCKCGNLKQKRFCHDLSREYNRKATAQLASSMAHDDLNELLGACKIVANNKTLECNEECRVLERNRRLAIGLQIRNPDLSQKLQTKYSDFVRNFTKRDPALVKSVYEALVTLVKLAKESKQKSRSHSFPIMNREKRQLVHELCEMFGVEAVAYDDEPNRNVVATAFKERCWMPATSIIDVMQREAGQRRVPVPSANVWSLKR